MKLKITNRKTNEINIFDWRKTIFNGFEEQFDGSIMYKVIEGYDYDNRKVHFYPAELITIEFEL